MHFMAGWVSWWRRLWRRRVGVVDARAVPVRRAPWWVPVRRLSPRHRSRIAAHLLALPEHDRYLRFGYNATDAHVTRYVSGLNFGRDEVFGIFNRQLRLVAVAHLAYSHDPQWASCAEFGVSVSPHQRGKGLGATLFAHAVTRSRNEGVRMLFVHALSENGAMLKIARNAGARVEREGSESEAYLRLPEATFNSQISGLVQGQMAQLDYQFKLQAQQFWGWLATMQEVREGVRQARHPQPPTSDQSHPPPH